MFQANKQKKAKPISEFYFTSKLSMTDYVDTVTIQNSSMYYLSRPAYGCCLFIDLPPNVQFMLLLPIAGRYRQ